MMHEYSETAWNIAGLYSRVLASETRDLAAHIDKALADERERCAEILDGRAAAYERGSPVSSMAEEVHGAATCREMARKIRGLGQQPDKTD